MTSCYLFDSHALLAFFQKEKGAQVVAEILQHAEEQRMDRLICVINLGEIIYMTKRRFGDRKKLEILAEFINWDSRFSRFRSLWSTRRRNLRPNTPSPTQIVLL